MGGVNDNVSGALFDTLTAAGTLLVIYTHTFILHGKGTFGTVLDTAVTLNTANLADLSDGLTLFIRVATHKNPSLPGNE